MAWTLAKSLKVLRNQVDAAYPKRSKASDGAIGNAAHQATASDHNPNAAQVVCALDLTHDPKHFNAHKWANRAIKKRHPNLKYIISNGRIAGVFSGWKWINYTGSNPHDKHVHISVGVGPDGASKQPYDDTKKWVIRGKKPNLKAIYYRLKYIKALKKISALQTLLNKIKSILKG